MRDRRMLLLIIVAVLQGFFALAACWLLLGRDNVTSRVTLIALLPPVFGFVVGSILFDRADVDNETPDGRLYVYDVDQDTIGWNLNLDSPVDEVPRKKIVKFEIVDRTQ